MRVEEKNGRIFIDGIDVLKHIGTIEKENNKSLAKIKKLQKAIATAIEYINKHIKLDLEYPSYMEMRIEEKNELLRILMESEKDD